MPEFIKQSQRNAKKQWVKRYYFCHVGRTGGRSISWNYLNAGWQIIQDEIIRPTREEVEAQYKAKRGTDKIMPSESFAIVRHPLDRLTSHMRWAIQNKKSKKEDFFNYISYAIDNMYDPDLARHIIPAFDSIFFDATVIQYELGFRRIADYLIENSFIEKWKKNIVIRENERLRVDWSKCPEGLKSKILKVYENDFDAFGYDPDDKFKK